MPADAVVSRELDALQQELSTSQRERAPPAAAASSSSAMTSKEAAEEHELREQLRELMKEVTGFFEEAEKNVVAHPTQSVIGAMLVGILIGRLLGRR
jgi:ElaB/YqjD/DUF883 family membrane-anchored ribosome-binding protein